MIEYIFNISICIVFALISYKLKILDALGSLSAGIIGLIILLTKGWRWFILLLIFLSLGAVVTKYKQDFKRKRLKERAARRAANVLANGIVPTFLAIISLKHDLTIPFISSIAVAFSDTLASEIGVLSNNAYLITNLRKVEAGTNGAISLLGEFIALIGAIVISIFAYFLMKISFYEAILCIVFGLIGCHIDSLLGATFQGRYKGNLSGEDAILTNSDVNLISISITVLISFIVVEMI